MTFNSGLTVEQNIIVICHQGTGLLLCEDDTSFEGEFSEDWTLNGKVQLNWQNI